MAWLAVDLNGTEAIYESKPLRIDNVQFFHEYWFVLPKGSIKRLIGDQLLKTHGKDHLTWDDEPVEFIEVVVE